MHSAFKYIASNWPLTTRLFQWPRSGPKEDHPATKERSGKHRPPLFKNGGHTDDVVKRGHFSTVESNPSESWEDIPTRTANPAGGDSSTMRVEPESSLPQPSGSKQDGNSRGGGSGISAPGGVDPRVHDYISALETHQKTIQYVMDRIFELNSLRTPVKQLEGLLHALDGFMGQLADYQDTVALPEDLTTNFTQLQRRFETLSRDELVSLRAREDKFDSLENDIIQSLFRSSRHLNRFFNPNPSNPSIDLRPEATPVLPQDHSDAGDEAVNRSLGMIQYLSQIGDVDVIQEKLMDLRSERAQLLEEQESRAHFGLSLDVDSLEFLTSSEQQERILLDELEYAQLVMDALEQLTNDHTALQISNDALANEPDEDSSTLDPMQEIQLPEFQAKSVGDGMSAPLYKGIQDLNLKFSNYLTGPAAIPVDPANFINIWLLHRMRSLPRLLSKLTFLLEQHYAGLGPKDLVRIFLEKWCSDSSASDFTAHRIFADQQSMLTNLGDSHNLEPKSVTATPLRPTTVPLLRLGPSTSAADIIAQAMQTQRITRPQDPHE